MKWELANAGETEALGESVGAALQAAAISKFLLLLHGNLGAGKTTFVRGLLRSYGHTGPVPSPTYTLVETYEMGSALIHHLDLYRLAAAAELEFLGWRELSDGLCIVEWPERARELLSLADFELHFRPSGDGRSVNAVAGSASGKKVGARVVGGASIVD